ALDVLGRGLRRGLTPELVDEGVHGDDLPATEEQESQKRAGLAGWNLENASATSGLKRPKDAELHRFGHAAAIQSTGVNRSSTGPGQSRRYPDRKETPCSDGFHVLPALPLCSFWLLRSSRPPRVPATVATERQPAATSTAAPPGRRAERPRRPTRSCARRSLRPRPGSNGEMRRSDSSPVSARWRSSSHWASAAATSGPHTPRREREPRTEGANHASCRA